MRRKSRWLQRGRSDCRPGGRVWKSTGRCPVDARGGRVHANHVSGPPWQDGRVYTLRCTAKLLARRGQVTEVSRDEPTTPRTPESGPRMRVAPRSGAHRSIWWRGVGHSLGRERHRHRNERRADGHGTGTRARGCPRPPATAPSARRRPSSPQTPSPAALAGIRMSARAGRTSCRPDWMGPAGTPATCLLACTT